MAFTEENNSSPDRKEAAKKLSYLNTLILVAVFLLGFVLPSTYKILAPFLFLIPVIISLVNKARQAKEKRQNPVQAQTYPPPTSDRGPAVDPYSYTPKDPKDPRRYKPIG